MESTYSITNIFDVLINLFTTAYNWCLDSWEWLTSPLPIIETAVDLIPDVVLDILPEGWVDKLMTSPIELIFGSAIVVVIGFAIVKFLR